MLSFDPTNTESACKVVRVEVHEIHSFASALKESCSQSGL